MVTGRHGIEAEHVRPAKQPVELDAAIALDARIGRRPAGVRGDVRTDDVALEVLREVEDHVVDVELLGDTAGIVDVGDAATPRVALATPQPHRHADDVDDRRERAARRRPTSRPRRSSQR